MCMALEMFANHTADAHDYLISKIKPKQSLSPIGLTEGHSLRLSALALAFNSRNAGSADSSRGLPNS
jgi:hypothetical protein